MGRMTIGDKLRAERKKMHKTTREVANDLGIGVSTVTMYETNKRVPVDRMKIKLAEYYGASIIDLFFS